MSYSNFIKRSMLAFRSCIFWSYYSDLRRIFFIPFSFKCMYMVANNTLFYAYLTLASIFCVLRYGPDVLKCPSKHSENLILDHNSIQAEQKILSKIHTMVSIAPIVRALSGENSSFLKKIQFLIELKKKLGRI